MTLKIIPAEERAASDGKKQKSFNPAGSLHKKKKNGHGILKAICLRLVHFINRGGNFTYQQIDELIVGLQRTILNLQKRKQELLKNRNLKFSKRKAK